ncbi:RNA guanine-N7 methyltransferase activating subunit [Phymastichus coffea]|uniref:RNA guanine-N7 methyltransferase activating subunit n=1 Tax=Phymastichus coffea TaxID=108790 RepID=UPI00273BD265|nr:RNA guanine-N7 methyltransferase activating subunit [Phymastichus coffea]
MELSKEQIEFLEKCEEEFKDRYTDKDEEFMKIKIADVAKPPIVENWFNGNQRQNNWSRSNQDRHWHDRDRNRQRDRYRERDHYRDREREGNSRYADKHHLYQRTKPW